MTRLLQIDGPCLRRNHDGPPIVVIAPGELILKPSHALRLSAACRRLQLSRRGLLDWLCEVFRDHDVILLNPDGSPFFLPEIADIFDDDNDGKWEGAFLRWASQPLKRPPQKRIATRLMLIDIALRIAEPDIYAAIVESCRLFAPGAGIGAADGLPCRQRLVE